MPKPNKSEPGARKPSRFGRHPQPGYSVKASIWVERDGQLYLGGGRVTLLEYLDKLGSISAAARVMGLTYRNAWAWIDSMNRLAASPLVEKTVGGPGGGHAVLTDEGRKAIAEYQNLREKMSKAVHQDTQETFYYY